MDIANKLYMDKRYRDLYILARFMYRVGYPILSDSDYDGLNRLIIRSNQLSEYVNRTYDDDPIPYNLIKEFSLSSYLPKLGTMSRYSKYLDEEKSLSISAVTNIDEVFDFVKKSRGQDLVLSLKVDGVNIKNLYVENTHELSMSRGRKGEGFDVTENARNVLPQKVDNSNIMLKVFTEMVVPKAHLAELQQRYNPDKYKTPKSSALSMLRVRHTSCDYDKLQPYAFNAEGFDCNTKLELLKKLEENGFKVVPHMGIKNEEIPSDRDKFNQWFTDLADEMYFKYKDIPSDGLVLEIDNLNFVDEINGQYSNRNIAVKLGYWKFDCYESIVTDIIFEQQRINKSCRINIEPVVTNDGATVSFINGYNPSIIIENNINIGSKVKFERHSNTISNLVLED